MRREGAVVNGNDNVDILRKIRESMITYENAMGEPPTKISMSLMTFDLLLRECKPWLVWTRKNGSPTPTIFGMKIEIKDDGF